MDGLSEDAQEVHRPRFDQAGGMSRDGLYKALSGTGNPTWSTILKVTNALGLKFSLHTVA